MNNQDVLLKLNVIFRDVLDQDSLIITPETTAADVEDWDSLSHINLISTIQKEFKLKFTLHEIQSLKNVGEMVELIVRKSA